VGGHSKKSHKCSRESQAKWSRKGTGRTIALEEGPGARGKKKFPPLELTKNAVVRVKIPDGGGEVGEAVSRKRGRGKEVQKKKIEERKEHGKQTRIRRAKDEPKDKKRKSGEKNPLKRGDVCGSSALSDGE